jgi:hypothetical protein
MKTISKKYVTFEQAKLLLEKGFDEYCIRCFTDKGISTSFTDYQLIKGLNKNSTVSLTDTKTEDFEYSDILCVQPEQWQVVEWLLQAYKIDVDVSTNRVLHAEKAEGYIAEIYTPKIYIPNWELGGNHQNREEAYSAAFDYIKNNNLI